MYSNAPAKVQKPLGLCGVPKRSLVDDALIVQPWWDAQEHALQPLVLAEITIVPATWRGVEHYSSALQGGGDDFGRGEFHMKILSFRKVAKISPGDIWGRWQFSVCLSSVSSGMCKGGKIFPIRKLTTPTSSSSTSFPNNPTSQWAIACI